MSLAVCTGWSPEGWHQYGRQFLESFNTYWPSGVRLFIYGEDAAGGLTLDRATALFARGLLRHELTFTTLGAIPGCREFLERNDNPFARGRARREDHAWKERALAAGYNWRFDAWKFCRQGFIPWHCAQQAKLLGLEYLVWLDGDVVTHRPVRSIEQVTSDLLPPHRSIAYLGREPKHPDIAFQLYRLTDLTALHTLANFSGLYDSDAVFSLKEWHSAYVWKHAVSMADAWSVVHNLTPGGSGHVWHQSVLREWGDHLKGERKLHGRSAERR